MNGPVVGIWHPGASSNYGDRAIQQATIDLVHGRWPDAQIVQYHRDPEAGAALYPDRRIRFQPMRAFGLPPTRKQLRELDVLLWGGGSLIQQSSLFYTPRHLLAAFAAAREGVRVIYFGTGVEPLRSRVLRWLVRRSFRRVFRDGFVRGHRSADLLESYGVQPRVRIAVDQAVSLESGDPARAREVLERIFGSAGRPVVSVCVKPTFIYRGGMLPVSIDPPSPARRKRRRQREALERSFAEFIRYLVDDVGVSVLLIPMFIDQGDLEVCHRVGVLADRSEVAVLPEMLPPRDLKALFGMMEAHVGVRLHSCILATAEGVPSVGVQYMVKHREYFEMLGIEQHLLLEEQVTADGLRTAFDDLWRERVALRPFLLDRVRQLTVDLQTQVDSILAGLDG